MSIVTHTPPSTPAALAEVVARLEAALPGRVERNARLGPLTTYRVGGAAAAVVRPASSDDLIAVAAVISTVADPGRVGGGDPGSGGRPSRGSLAVPVLVLGRGSNLLVADRGFAGVALVLGECFETLTIPTVPGSQPDETPSSETATAGGQRKQPGPSGQPAFAAIVEAGAAVALPILARRSAAAGWAGLEFYVGIPGSVGGAVRMNAGGHGTDTAAVLVDASIADLRLDGRPRRHTAAELELGYRRSVLDEGEIVLGARFRVTLDAAASATERVDEIVRWRREHQPGGANAGSVFTNPPGDSAGRLIDLCGARGLRSGGAQVSVKHANFIQADAGASATDVVRLIRAVQSRVEDQTGIRLVPEIRLIGFDIDEDGAP